MNFPDIFSVSMDADLLRFAFVFGILVSLFLYDKFHLGTGSLIVPGFFGILLFEPLVLIQCVLVSLICFGFVHKILPRYLILMPPTKFSLLILTSVSVQFLLGISDIFSLSSGVGVESATIGYLLPGLIGHEMSRQGPIQALKNIGLSTLIVAFALVTAIGFQLQDLGTANFPVQETLAFDLTLLPIMMLVSVAFSLAIKHFRGLKTGGFVSAAYAAMLLGNPLGAVSLLMLSLLTFCFVKRILMPNLILFGRKKFAAMLLVGSIGSWSFVKLIELLYGDLALALGFSNFSVMSILLAGLIANDIERVGLPSVATGLLLNIAFVANFTMLIGQFIHGSFDPVTVSVLSLLLLFQIVFIGWKKIASSISAKNAAIQPTSQSSGQFEILEA